MPDAPKRLGRPPLDRDDPSEHLHVRIPSKQYAALSHRAARERLTTADLVRRALDRELGQTPPDQK